jgi:hypothetical protein
LVVVVALETRLELHPSTVVAVAVQLPLSTVALVVAVEARHTHFYLFQPDKQ